MGPTTSQARTRGHHHPPERRLRLGGQGVNCTRRRLGQRLQRLGRSSCHAAARRLHCLGSSALGRLQGAARLQLDAVQQLRGAGGQVGGVAAHRIDAVAGVEAGQGLACRVEVPRDEQMNELMGMGCMDD